MSNHRVTVIGSLDNCQARCSCKAKSPIGDRGVAEGWWYAHRQEVERAKAHLGTRTPTLKQQHAWFLSQAEDTTNDPDDRVLWRQLADEIDRHFSRKPVGEQIPLF